MRILVCIGLAALGGLACSKTEPKQTHASQAATAQEQSSSPHNAYGAGEQVGFETSSFKAGTLPGRFPRLPEREPALDVLKLGPFKIDRFPYPNDPKKPPELGMSLELAGRRCSERGGRLCSELEWERACKTTKSHPFSTGDHWNCQDPMGCGTGDGVVGMGAFAEWTSSRFGNPLEIAGESVIRGAPLGGAEDDHRCARRHRMSELKASSSIAFRCCYGAPNGAKILEAREQTAFEFADIDAKKLSALLAAHPATEQLSKDVVLFKDPDAIQTVIRRGPGDKKGFDFTVKPLLWRPVPGTEYLVVAGRSGKKTSFVVAFYAVPDGSYSVSSSFTMKDEVGPVVLAYSPSIRPRLHFSTCWGCLGETGKILFREPDSAVILQP